MRLVLAIAAMFAVLGTGAAHAQGAIESRVDRLEREMRAVQRKVFPGGAGATVEPQITAQNPLSIPGTPSTTPITDLTQRVTALESQIATITGQVETTQYRIRQLEEAFNAYKRTVDARLTALEESATRVGSTEAAIPAPVETASTPAPKPPPKPATPPADEPAKPAATGTRASKVAEIERPSTDDPAEDLYIYGYRLWSAKFYPEARKELEQVSAKYPKHRRASYAQNLLGRAYLDAGAPSLAAVAFYENYKKNPNGERAPDSLYYLAQALVELKKPSSEICKVYSELTEIYGDKISESMKNGVAEGRAANKCK